MKKIIMVIIAIIMGLMIMSLALNAKGEEIKVTMLEDVDKNEEVDKQIREKTVLELQNMLPEQYVEIKLFAIKWTQNERNTGKEIYCTQGIGGCGPMGIALDTFNNIYVLDIGCGVKKYNEIGELIGVFKGQNYELSNMDDIEISEDGKYIYGINNGRMERYIYKYNMEEHRGERVEEGFSYKYKIIPYGVEVYRNGTLVKRYGGSKELMNKNRNEDKMKDVINIEKKNVFRTNKLNMAKTYNEDYQVYNSLRCYYIGKDRNNNYYIATYYKKKSQSFDEPAESKTVVYKYKETGEILSAIILEEEGIDYLNYHFEKHLRVNKDGEVYYLCPKKDGAVIYKYERVK